jgi:hypothetical protein
MAPSGAPAKLISAFGLSLPRKRESITAVGTDIARVVVTGFAFAEQRDEAKQ